MLNRLKEELHWVAIFLIAQLGLFSIYYRDFETKFFPVVSYIEIIPPIVPHDDGLLIWVKFEKMRECEFLGVRVFSADGQRIHLQFLDDDDEDESYRSRAVGPQVSGPWLIDTKNIADKQIEAIHKCDPFSTTKSILQKSDKL